MYVNVCKHVSMHAYMCACVHAYAYVSSVYVYTL